MLWKTFIYSVLLLLAVGEAARPDENASDKKDPAPQKDDSNYKAEKAEIRVNDYSQAEKAAADAQKRDEAWMKKYMVSPDRRARGYTAVPKA
jgi:hypothetical protein